jgi:transaldolase
MDDWVKVLVSRDGILLRDDAAEWAGIAVFKRAYPLFQERGYRARLLAAAYRNTLHWTELVGGDVTLTMPFVWQQKFDASGLEPSPRIDEPVDPAILSSLLEITDFRRAYEPDGMTPAEFESFGPSARTLRAFIKSYHDLQGAIRDVYLPDPDVIAA